MGRDDKNDCENVQTSRGQTYPTDIKLYIELSPQNNSPYTRTKISLLMLKKLKGGQGGLSKKFDRKASEDF